MTIPDDSKGDERLEWGGGGSVNFFLKFDIRLLSGPKKISNGAFETMI